MDMDNQFNHFSSVPKKKHYTLFLAAMFVALIFPLLIIQVLRNQRLSIRPKAADLAPLCISKFSGKCLLSCTEGYIDQLETKQTNLCPPGQKCCYELPKKSKIAYIKRTPDKNGYILEQKPPYLFRDDVYVLDPANNITAPLTVGGKNTKSIYHRYQSWSPDGKYVAYMASDLINGDLLLYIMDVNYPDKPHLLVSGVDNAQGNKILWSPDGKYLAYYDYFYNDNLMKNRREIEVKLNTENKEDKPVCITCDNKLCQGDSCADGLVPTSFSGINWLPDGKTIMFLAEYEVKDSKSFKIFTSDITNLSFSQLNNFGEFRAVVNEPVLSPNGKYLVYVSKDNKTVDSSEPDYNLYLAILNSGKKHAKLTDRDKDNQIWNPAGPVWSPDSNKLLYHSGNYIYTYAFNNPDQTAAGWKVGAGEFGSWSPDSQWIVYSGDSDNNDFKLYIVRFDNSAQINLPKFVPTGQELAEDYDPVWSPVSYTE